MTSILLRATRRACRPGFALLALGVLAGAAGAQQGPAPRPASARAARAVLVRTLDSIAAEAQKDGPIAGMTVAVVRGRDTLLHKGYGLADVEQRAAATPQTVYRIGSITKQFTASAVMRLVEAGKVSLDDPIVKHLPNAPVHGRSVTIRHLLNHTSGLKSYTGTGPRFAAMQRADLTPDSIVGITRTDSLDFEPGTKWSYNNTGYVLLGMLVEKHTGMPWADYVADSLARPLGLTSTRYCPAEAVIRDRAAGYEPSGTGFRNAPYLSMTIPYAAGALCSTSGDLLKWERALSTGKVVSPASYARMTQVDSLASTKAPLDYGFGLQLGMLEGHRRVYHNGGIHGFISELHAWPDDSLVVVVLTNTAPSNPGRLARNLARAVLGLTSFEKAPPKPKDLPLTVARSAYVGEYELRLPNGTVMPTKVWEEDGALLLLPRGQRALRLYHQGEHAFVTEVPGIRVVFTVEHGRATKFTLHQGPQPVEAPRVR